jgi:hypothetical protein
MTMTGHMGLQVQASSTTVSRLAASRLRSALDEERAGQHGSKRTAEAETGCDLVPVESVAALGNSG